MELLSKPYILFCNYKFDQSMEIAWFVRFSLHCESQELSSSNPASVTDCFCDLGQLTQSLCASFYSCNTASLLTCLPCWVLW